MKNNEVYVVIGDDIEYFEGKEKRRSLYTENTPEQY